MPNREWIIAGALAFMSALYAASAPPTPTLPQDEPTIEAIQQVLLTRLRESGPRAALDDFRRRVASDPRFASRCHPVAHALGHAAYEATADFSQALADGDDVCNSGYVHGVIEGLFMSAPDADRVAAAACASAPDGSYRQWSCWHGIGHGHMTATENDLPEALARCGRLQGEFASDACVNGVFMENFNADERLHPSRHLSRDDVFFPCEEVPESQRDDCYFYAPTWYLRLHPLDYGGALRNCSSAPVAHQGSCAAGVGSQTMKENVAAPDIAERVCDAGPPEFAWNCIDGMIGLYMNHHASLAAGERLCGGIAPRHFSACINGLRHRAPMFTE